MWLVLCNICIEWKQSSTNYIQTRILLKSILTSKSHLVVHDCVTVSEVGLRCGENETHWLNTWVNVKNLHVETNPTPHAVRSPCLTCFCWGPLLPCLHLVRLGAPGTVALFRFLPSGVFAVGPGPASQVGQVAVWANSGIWGEAAEVQTGLQSSVGFDGYSNQHTETASDCMDVNTAGKFSFRVTTNTHTHNIISY